MTTLRVNAHTDARRRRRRRRLKVVECLFKTTWSRRRCDVGRVPDIPARVSTNTWMRSSIASSLSERSLRMQKYSVAKCRYTCSQGLPLVHVRAQLEHLRNTSRGKLGCTGDKDRSS